MANVDDTDLLSPVEQPIYLRDYTGLVKKFELLAPEIIIHLGFVIAYAEQCEDLVVDKVPNLDMPTHLDFSTIQLFRFLDKNKSHFDGSELNQIGQFLSLARLRANRHAESLELIQNNIGEILRNLELEESSEETNQDDDF